MLPATSTTHAPWYVVPANHKWYRNMVVAERIVGTLAGMKLKPPKGPAGIDFDTLKIPD
jgi:polyphosphate kinase 2 (PPK2 family)